MKKISAKWLIGSTVLVIAGLLFWSSTLQKNDPNIIARDGIHWHPQLHMYIDDVEQSIPENIGLIGGHQPMHTHVEDASKGVLHFEFDGTVRPRDLRLGRFFQIWGRDMDSFGKNMRMMVNGNESMEYGDYFVQSDDVIELYYDSPNEE